jgi:hypothetical protein
MSGGGSTADAEPLFILDPLPHLGPSIDAFFAANPLIILAGAIVFTAIFVKVEDPMKKLFYLASFNLLFDWQITSSLFHASIFTAVLVSVYCLIWSASIWDEVKTHLDLTNLRIISWLSFAVMTFLISEVLVMLSAPFGGAIVLGAISAWYLWWTYYSLEPAVA